MGSNPFGKRALWTLRRQKEKGVEVWKHGGWKGRLEGEFASRVTPV